MKQLFVFKRTARILRILRLASGSDEFLINLRTALNVAQKTFGPVAQVQRIDQLDSFCRPYHANTLRITDACSLDIGCGLHPRNPFGARILHGIDIRQHIEGNVHEADLAVEPIPFSDNTFDYITAFDFIEHIPRVMYNPGRRFPFIELMNEIWRALKPQGIFLSYTPVFPFNAVFRDPTHVNVLTCDTFPLYFDNKNRWASVYGFCGAFNVLSQGLRPPHLVSILQKGCVLEPSD